MPGCPGRTRLATRHGAASLREPPRLELLGIRLGLGAAGRIWEVESLAIVFDYSFHSETKPLNCICMVCVVVCYSYLLCWDRSSCLFGVPILIRLFGVTLIGCEMAEREGPHRHPQTVLLAIPPGSKKCSQSHMSGFASHYQVDSSRLWTVDV